MRKSLTILGTTVAAGLLLQLFFGGIDVRVLAFPVNLILCALLLLAVAALALYREKAAFRVLSGTAFSVSAIVTLTALCLVMGLVPQRAHGGVLTGVVSSWPFVLVYLTLLLSLGCVIARSLMNFSAQRWAFYFNHIGLWLALAGAGFGSADRREMSVQIPEGETALHAEEGMLTYELPFAVRLDDFRMEEYPARWGLVDIRTGKFQPAGSPVFYNTEDEAWARNPSPDVHERVASTIPEPKSFASDVTVIFPDGRTKQASVEVNRPYRWRGWSVYQSGYDREAGPASEYSVFKVVRDRWLPVVYAGMAMLAAGAFSMFALRRRKGEENGI